MALTQIGKGGLGSTIGIGTNSPDRSLHVAGTEPSIVFEKTDESTDLKTFRIFMNSSSLQIGTVDDAFSAGVTAIEITRDNTDAITGINVRSEGGATTTSLQQGLAKSWLNHKGSGSGDVIRDSINTASAVDNGTGHYTYTFTNAFSNDDFSFTYCGSQSGAETTYQMSTASQATGTHSIQLKNAAGTVTDRDFICGTFHGDLA